MHPTVRSSERPPCLSNFVVDDRQLSDQCWVERHQIQLCVWQGPPDLRLQSLGKGVTLDLSARLWVYLCVCLQAVNGRMEQRLTNGLLTGHAYAISDVRKVWLSVALTLCMYQCWTSFLLIIFSTRCNIYISRLCYDVIVHLSVCLSVMEVCWRIIANLGFKFRPHFTAHCGHRCRWRHRGHQCAGGVSSDIWWMGVRRLAVANGPNIFQMLLVFSIVRTLSWL